MHERRLTRTNKARISFPGWLEGKSCSIPPPPKKKKKEKEKEKKRKEKKERKEVHITITNTSRQFHLQAMEGLFS